jgi:hypothetical protein
MASLFIHGGFLFPRASSDPADINRRVRLTFPPESCPRVPGYIATRTPAAASGVPTEGVPLEARESRTAMALR